MNKPAKLITLGDIAELARVSRTTVSLALRNSPRISKRVRTQIQSVARKLGYRQNPLVTAHMSYVRSLHPRYTGQCIALIGNQALAQIEADTLRPLRKYLHATRARAQGLGYELELFNLAEAGMTSQRLSKILVARGITGVIFLPLDDGVGLVSLPLDPTPFAMVMIEHVFIEPRLHKVCDDQFSTIGRMIQRLLDFGYTRIGIAMSSRADDHANHYWLAGYQAFQSLSEPSHRIPHFISPEWTKEKFLGWYREWKPEAIITIDEDVVVWLREAGLRVPEDIGCATLYWKDDRSYLSGFYQNHEHIGAGAVDLVASQLYHNERGLPFEQKTMLVEAVWKVGKTLVRKTPAGTHSPLRVWTR
ncbi:MAG: LacI family DNA-binding transcriptional regulator [Opitutaceae bacterium]|nr:LacI family DNA-binding transcriptional regulator [Opitutaceae bacterium]